MEPIKFGKIIQKNTNQRPYIGSSSHFSRYIFNDTKQMP